MKAKARKETKDDGAGSDKEMWDLRLYVAGQSPKSLRDIHQPESFLRKAPCRQVSY